MYKHKWIHLFLEQIKNDLSKIDLNWRGVNNLTKEERRVCRELKKAPDIVIKGSDNGGNIVLLSQTTYEQEVMRLLLDKSTYLKLISNPFPDIVVALNYQLSLATEESLISKEFN